MLLIYLGGVAMKRYRVELKSKFGATLISTILTASSESEAISKARSNWKNSMKEGYYIVATPA